MGKGVAHAVTGSQRRPYWLAGSHLRHLCVKRLPINVLKIDIQFVRDLDTNKQNQQVVKAIVMLAHGFGRQTVAEGVETQATLDLLNGYGVNYAQGYAIGRPAPLDALLGSLSVPAILRDA